MRIRVVLATALLGASLALVGCGEDNLTLCDGCGSPTPTPSLTPAPTITATPTTPTPTPAPTSTP